MKNIKEDEIVALELLMEEFPELFDDGFGIREVNVMIRGGFIQGIEIPGRSRCKTTYNAIKRLLDWRDSEITLRQNKKKSR